MQIITTTDSLTDLCKRLSDHPYVTIDTEFLRESTFWPKLCLIQIASEDESAIIDPLAQDFDLAPLLELLQNPDVMKVFHAGRQDLEIFHHMTGEVPTPLFDTQVAAMVCGFGESVGYDTLVTKITGKGIDKSSRFTDWSRRPLTERQLKYAEADVTHLREVYKFLKGKLEKTGRASWVASEMEILRSPDTYFTPPENAWQRIKARSNKPRFLAILKTTAAWRERQAHLQDLPRNRVLRDEALLEIASNPPKNAEKLSHVRGIGKKFADGKMGAGLLAAIEEGLAMPEEDCPAVPLKVHHPKGIGPLMDLLRVLLKQRCEENDVAQKLVCSTSDLEKIAAEDNPDTPVLSGWRHDIFGKDALALKEGKIAFTAKGRKIQVISLTD
ncbi:ribonuclease D [Sneathiella chinensis]|uniref:Ribonuclease D n=1 Tax=Sneathiella chinensis TaxID=349750 RepID=A0ABQ5U701_9PROT|nr:ribonuclease D [Sneathiella chinensis]GLQ07044.1 ribonuclease D [Sneathiella chinensis]